MKRNICIAAFFLWILLGVVQFAMISSAWAQDEDPLTIGLAENRIAITTGFNGARLDVFGVKRGTGDLAVVVRGPEKEMTVRHKTRVMGIWMNSDSVTFRGVPAFYDYAVGSSLDDLASPDVLKKYGIGLDALSFHHIGKANADTAERFREALIRNKQTQGLFPLSAKNLFFLNGDFFKASFYMPPDVPPGQYNVQAYLFKDGKLLARRDAQLRVGQVGFSASLFSFAWGQSVFYGLAAVLMALAAGTAAWASMRRE